MAMTDLKASDVFAGYRIERRIGGGGMGVVYEAVELSLDRQVALKLIASDAARDPAFRERFAAESRIAAQVEHPNVVPIYAVGEHEDVPFLAMRLVSGPNLGEMIASLRHLEPTDAATIISKVAAGLGAIHGAGLIHRDVKPANILLSGPGTREHVYLTDFGVAKQVAETSELTGGGQVLGTLDYVAPELIERRPADARSDVYALGCVLYKALTGKVPFAGEDAGAKLWAHMNQEPPLPSATVGVSEAFDEVVVRAMAKDPSERYGSAEDLGRAALAAAHGQGSLGTDPSEAPAPHVPRSEAATRRLAPAATVPTASQAVAGRGVRGSLVTMVVVAALAALAVTLLIRELGGGGRSEAAQRFIDRADAICAQSRRHYARVASRQPNTRAAAVQQTETLQGIASQTLGRLRVLRPPAELAANYRIYLAQRQLMVYQLGQAKRAVSRGDVGSLRTAFARIDAQQPLRRQSAREIGLEKCSGAGG
jgi:predicted Ser/Thr protein kinase